MPLAWDPKVSALGFAVRPYGGKVGVGQESHVAAPVVPELLPPSVMAKVWLHRFTAALACVFVATTFVSVAEPSTWACRTNVPVLSILAFEILTLVMDVFLKSPDMNWMAS